MTKNRIYSVTGDGVVSIEKRMSYALVQLRRGSIFSILIPLKHSNKFYFVLSLDTDFDNKLNCEVVWTGRLSRCVVHSLNILSKRP